MQNMLSTQRDFSYLMKVNKEDKRKQMGELSDVLHKQMKKVTDEKERDRKLWIEERCSMDRSLSIYSINRCPHGKHYKCSNCRRSYPRKLLTKRHLHY